MKLTLKRTFFSDIYFSRLKNLLVIAAVVLVGALGYYLYSQNQLSTLVVSDSEVASQAAAESAAFLDRLAEIKRVDLNVDILNDPRFRSLRDNRLPVIEENVGRPNPFVE